MLNTRSDNFKIIIIILIFQDVIKFYLFFIIQNSSKYLFYQIDFVTFWKKEKKKSTRLSNNQTKCIENYNAWNMW